MKKREDQRNQLEFLVEKEFHRLHQQFLKLQELGLIPKSRKLKRSNVKFLALIIGITELEKLTYEDFEKKLKELKTKM